MKRYKKELAYAVLCFSLFGVVVSLDAVDKERELELYCSMVSDYKESNGEHGWPDYNDKYKERCDAH